VFVSKFKKNLKIFFHNFLKFFKKYSKILKNFQTIVQEIQFFQKIKICSKNSNFFQKFKNFKSFSTIFKSSIIFKNYCNFQKKSFILASIFFSHTHFDFLFFYTFIFQSNFIISKILNFHVSLLVINMI